MKKRTMLAYKKSNLFIFKIFTFITIGLVVAHLTLTQANAVENSLDKLRLIWRSGNYSKVTRLLIEYREMPYGKNPEVDYMIATSLCRQPKFKQDGYKFFKWVLYNYSLDKKSQDLVKKEMQQCAPVSKPLIINFLASLPKAHVGGRGKIFRLDEGVLTSPVQVVKEIPANEFTDRLFTIPNRTEGIKHIQNLVGSGFQIESSGQFIVASSSGHSQSDLKFISGVLQKALNSFTSQYRMPFPKYLISVYLVPDKVGLKKLSNEIHGIEISKDSIGYSFQDDLSMVGVIPSRGDTPIIGVGTLIHELFHSQVHNDFGDIPPWMDEGMAALYEVSEIREDRILGKPNWRGQILKEYWQVRPSIEELVTKDWNSFDNIDRDPKMTSQTINHATARYFMLYLQDNKKLNTVYSAFRNRTPTEVRTNDPATDNVRLLESVLQQPISKVDEDFTKWFKSLNSEV